VVAHPTVKGRGGGPERKGEKRGEAYYSEGNVSQAGPAERERGKKERETRCRGLSRLWNLPFLWFAVRESEEREKKEHSHLWLK